MSAFSLSHRALQKMVYFGSPAGSLMRENQAAQDEPSSALQPGTPAPDFTLQSTPDHSVSLSEFRGHPVILAFYPADWSPVCGDQMALYNEVLPEFRRFHAELIGI